MAEAAEQNITSLSGLNAVVVGLGLTGEATAAFLLKAGCRVVATDPKSREQAGESADRLERMGAVLELGGHREDSFTGADLIVVSPGVPPSIPPLAAARKKGVAITGEIELAAKFLRKPVAAVTGTNGKTTVTSLLGGIFEAAGKRVFVGGNIGRPLIAEIGRQDDYDVFVLELSSFQLETSRTLKPAAGILLNVTQDHMDRYEGMHDYFAAKAALFARQDENDAAILNADDPLAVSVNTRARRLMFSRSVPQENGAWLEGGRMVLAFGGRRIAESPLDRLQLVGAHNQENVMAAVLAAVSMGVRPETAFDAAEGFKGLPHRVEFIGEYGGVRYYDDSKGTNVGAVIKSLEGFDSPVILIAGGRDKDSDFSPLKELVGRKVRLLVLLGEAKDKMAGVLAAETETVLADSMEQAVAVARLRANPGDVVLLSPACASFDMFTGYAQRGETFARLVREKAA